MKEIFEGYLTENKGLSSTSANYIANLGKEYIVELEAKLKSITCYNTYNTIISANEMIQTDTGITDEQLNEFNEILEKIASIKSLTAWLREAIKSKESRIANVKRTQMRDWVNDTYHINIDEYITQNEYKHAEYDRTIDEQAKYLKSETFAAVYGQFIHQNSPFNAARKRYYDVINKPKAIEGNGQDRIIVSYKPSVSSENLEDTYMTLQHTWREYEASLNKMKYDTEQENTKREIAAKQDYNEKLTKYKEYVNLYHTWQTSEINRISKLKIFIPDMFVETYKFLESLGKVED